MSTDSITDAIELWHMLYETNYDTTYYYIIIFSCSCQPSFERKNGVEDILAAKKVCDKFYSFRNKSAFDSIAVMTNQSRCPIKDVRMTFSQVDSVMGPLLSSNLLGAETHVTSKGGQSQGEYYVAYLLQI